MAHTVSGEIQKGSGLFNSRRECHLKEFRELTEFCYLCTASLVALEPLCSRSAWISPSWNAVDCNVHCCCRENLMFSRPDLIKAAIWSISCAFPVRPSFSVVWPDHQNPLYVISLKIKAEVGMVNGFLDIPPYVTTVELFLWKWHFSFCPDWNLWILEQSGNQWGLVPSNAVQSQRAQGKATWF